MLLAANSQHTRYRSRFQGNGLPVLSWPPIQPINNLYRPARCKRRRAKLKIERLNDKKSAKLDMIEMAHVECASAAQPHGSTSNRVHGVYRPSCQCESLEIKAIKVNPAWNGETTYLWCVHVMHPCRNASNWVHGVNGPSHQCRRLKIEAIKVNQAQNGKTTYLRHADIVQPLETPSRRCYRVHIPSRQHGVSQSEVLGRFYNPNTTPKDKERVVVCLRRTGQELH